MGLLQLLQAPHQQVKFGIGDLGLVLDVVQPLVPPNLLPQPFDLPPQRRIRTHDCNGMLLSNVSGRSMDTVTHTLVGVALSRLFFKKRVAYATSAMVDRKSTRLNSSH